MKLSNRFGLACLIMSALFMIFFLLGSGKMESMLLQAAEHGNLVIVKLLLTARVKVGCRDQYDRTPLMLAAKNGHVNVIEALTANGADVNGWERHFQTSPLLYAVNSKDLASVKVLLDRGANVNFIASGGRTALMDAVWLGLADIAQLLIDKGADVNWVDQERRTVLEKAKYKGNAKIIDLLKVAGAKDRDGVITP